MSVNPALEEGESLYPGPVGCLGWESLEGQLVQPLRFPDEGLEAQRGWVRSHTARVCQAGIRTQDSCLPAQRSPGLPPAVVLTCNMWLTAPPGRLVKRGRAGVLRAGHRAVNMGAGPSPPLSASPRPLLQRPLERAGPAPHSPTGPFHGPSPPGALNTQGELGNAAQVGGCGLLEAGPWDISAAAPGSGNSEGLWSASGVSEGLGGQMSAPGDSRGLLPPSTTPTTQDPRGPACMADLLWGWSNSLP